MRRLYGALDDAGRAAVQEATHDPAGRVDRERFRAKYGRLPDFGTAKDPTPLRLFLPRDWQLPAELHAILRTFVPPPRAVGLAASDDLPEAVPLKPPAWGRRRESRVEVPLRQRATAPVAEREVRAVLRLIEAGKVRVSDKTRRPIGETIDAVRGVLVGGDFYGPADESDDDGDPASDLAIRAFAWPSLVQAAGLAAVARNTLGLTAAGRKAHRPAAPRRAPQPLAEVARHDGLRRVPPGRGDQGPAPRRADGRGPAAPGGGRRPPGVPGRALGRRRRAVPVPAGHGAGLRGRAAARGSCTSPTRSTAASATTTSTPGSSSRAGSSWRCCSSPPPRWGCWTWPTSRRRRPATTSGRAGGPTTCPA